MQCMGTVIQSTQSCPALQQINSKEISKPRMGEEREGGGREGRRERERETD